MGRTLRELFRLAEVLEARQLEEAKRLKNTILDIISSPTFITQCMSAFQTANVEETATIGNLPMEQVAQEVINVQEDVSRNTIAEFISICRARSLTDEAINKAVNLIYKTIDTSTVFDFEINEEDEEGRRLHKVANYLHENPRLYDDLIILRAR